MLHVSAAGSHGGAGVTCESLQKQANNESGASGAKPIRLGGRGRRGRGEEEGDETRHDCRRRRVLGSDGGNTRLGLAAKIAASPREPGEKFWVSGSIEL